MPHVSEDEETRLKHTEEEEEEGNFGAVPTLRSS